MEPVTKLAADLLIYADKGTEGLTAPQALYEAFFLKDRRGEGASLRNTASIKSILKYMRQSNDYWTKGNLKRLHTHKLLKNIQRLPIALRKFTTKNAKYSTRDILFT